MERVTMVIRVDRWPAPPADQQALQLAADELRRLRAELRSRADGEANTAGSDQDR
jgi:hypothetical protein